MGSMIEGWREARAALRENDPVRGHGRGLPLGANLVIIPLAMTAIAVLVTTFAYVYDRRVAYHGGWYPRFLRFDGQEEVVVVMTAAATVTITVVTLLASLTLVALTTASTSLGPRQIRAFLRDPVIKLTIGLFLATFVCAVLFLPWVNIGNDAFVPSATAGVVFVLLILSSLSLPFFLNHVATMIQPNRVLARVARDLNFAVREYGQGRGPFDTSQAVRLPDAELGAHLAGLEGCTVVRSPISGYLQRVYHAELVTEAGRAGAVVHFLKRPGHFVLRHEPLAELAGPPEMEAAVLHAVDIRAHRTLRQDLEFAIDQLVETGIRALSPAINDTFTGLIAVDWLADAVRQLADADTGTPAHRDAEGTVRVIDRPLPFRSIVHAAFDKIRQAGAGNPAIVIRLFETFERLAPFLRDDEQRDLLRAQLDATWEAALAAGPVELDRRGMDERGQRARRALAPRGA